MLDADKIDEVGEWIAVVHWDGNDEYLSADGHTLFRVTKAPSEVCWSLPAKTVPVDKPVLLTGALVPAISGDASILQEDGTVDSANIEGEPTTFRLTDPDGTVEEFPVETETGGKFQKKYTFDSAGDWTLEIFWGGNDIYRGCDGKTVVNVYIEPPKAIVILGGDKDDPDFDTFNTIANEVYRALRKRGFADEDIYYLNPREQQVEQATREIPLLYDGESIHVDNITSKQELEYAITDWAAEYVGPHTPLLIYLLSHNTGDSFLLERSSNAKLHLLPNELDDWISELENTLLTTYEQVPAQDAERLPVAQAPGSADVPPESLPVSSITIFIDACNSGSFLEPLAEEVKNSKDEVVVNRTVITSTDVGEPAYISTADSFSSSFFKCFCTYDVKSAFEEASNIIAEYSKQKPLLDSNGNGVPNEPADYAGVEGLEISGTSRIAATLPTIESVSFEPSQLEQGDSAAISVKLSVLALGDPREQDAESLSVSGVLIPPSYNRDRQLEQWSELESGLINITFQKKDDDANVGPEGIYESNAHEFTECGKYVLIVHADSRNGDAVPYKTQIEVERIQVVEPTNEQTTQPEIVENTMLHQNYPNPFIPDTWVPYQLKDDADVVIKIYTVTGQLVRTLNPGHKPAGFYTAKDRAAYWDGKNEAGEHVASGIYFYAIQAGDFTDTKKMVAVK